MNANKDLIDRNVPNQCEPNIYDIGQNIEQLTIFVIGSSFSMLNEGKSLLVLELFLFTNNYQSNVRPDCYIFKDASLDTHIDLTYV